MKIRKLRDQPHGQAVAAVPTCTKVHVTVRGTVLILPRARSAPGTTIETTGAGAGEQVERAVIVGGILISASFLAATALNRWAKEEPAPVQAAPAPECIAPIAADTRSPEPRTAKDPCDRSAIDKPDATAAAGSVQSEPPAH